MIMPLRFRRCFLMAGASIGAIAIASSVSTAFGATFYAANETELYDAIANAQASGDAASTIQLTRSFTVITAPPAIVGKALTIDTGSNSLTLASGNTFDVANDASLTLSGNVQGSGILATGMIDKSGAGELVIDGVTGPDFSKLALRDGHMLVTGGSVITYGTSVGGTYNQLNLASSSDDKEAKLTVSGAGTKLVGTGSDFNDIGGDVAGGGRGALIVEKGGWVEAATAFRLSNNGTVVVIGQGSGIKATALSGVTGASKLNILDGGLVEVGTGSFGGATALAHPSARMDGRVSGQGSKLDVAGALHLHRGTLSILDGGLVKAGTVNIASGLGSATQFDTVVSGSSSVLSAADTINLATRHKGTLTVANGGKVAAPTLTVGSDTVATSNATLNVGGAVGEAAQASGIIEATEIKLLSSGVLNFNHTDASYDFDAGLTGAGTINHIGSGKTVLTNDHPVFAGHTNVHAGILAVNGQLSGTMDVFGGRLQGNGTVGDTVNHFGGIIAPGNSIGTFTIGGDYTSNGGGLEVEAELGADNSPTDLLIITGDSILGTGATQVRVINVGGTGGETTADGIRIVEVQGARSDADAFALAGPAIGGAYRYGLFQHDLTGMQDDGDWYLRSAGLAPTVPVYENYPQVLLGLVSLPTLQQRVGERHRTAGEAEQTAVWTRIEAAHGHARARASITDASYDSDTALVQIGVDGQLSDSAAGMLVGGLTAQFSRASADIFSSLGDGSNTTDSYGIGANLTWYGEGGFYLDGQAQLATLRSDMGAAGVGTIGDGIHGSGYALSLEVGRKIALGNEWSLTPQAQLAYSSVDFDTFTDPFGAEVALRKGDSLKGRLGIAANYDAAAAGSHVYGIANLTYEFMDGTSVAVSGIDASFVPQRFGGELGFGGSYKWGGGKYKLHGEALAATSFQGGYGVKGTLGFTTGF